MKFISLSEPQKAMLAAVREDSKLRRAAVMVLEARESLARRYVVDDVLIEGLDKVWAGKAADLSEALAALSADVAQAQEARTADIEAWSDFFRADAQHRCALDNAAHLRIRIGGQQAGALYRHDGAHASMTERMAKLRTDAKATGLSEAEIALLAQSRGLDVATDADEAERLFKGWRAEGERLTRFLVDPVRDRAMLGERLCAALVELSGRDLMRPSTEMTKLLRDMAAAGPLVD